MGFSFGATCPERAGSLHLDACVCVCVIVRVSVCACICLRVNDHEWLRETSAVMHCSQRSVLQKCERDPVVHRLKGPSPSAHTCLQLLCLNVQQLKQIKSLRLYCGGKLGMFVSSSLKQRVSLCEAEEQLDQKQARAQTLQQKVKGDMQE